MVICEICDMESRQLSASVKMVDAGWLIKSYSTPRHHAYSTDISFLNSGFFLKI